MQSFWIANCRLTDKHKAAAGMMTYCRRFPTKAAFTDFPWGRLIVTPYIARSRLHPCELYRTSIKNLSSIDVRKFHFFRGSILRRPRQIDQTFISSQTDCTDFPGNLVAIRNLPHRESVHMCIGTRRRYLVLRCPFKMPHVPKTI